MESAEEYLRLLEDMSDKERDGVNCLNLKQSAFPSPSHVLGYLERDVKSERSITVMSRIKKVVTAVLFI